MTLDEKDGSARAHEGSRRAGGSATPLAPGAASRVAWRLHTDPMPFPGADGRRVVEPGETRLSVGFAETDLPLSTTVTLTGQTCTVAEGRLLVTPTRTEPLED